MIKLIKLLKKIKFIVLLYNSIKKIKSKIKGKIIKNKKYFNLNKIKNKIGPVVLVSREIAYTFPLSYAYLAGYLIQKGIDIKIIFKHSDYDKLSKEIISLNPILVGFGNLYPELREIKSIITYLNKNGRDFPIVIGGQMFSPIPEFALKITGADFGVIGEGEIILYNLVKALKEHTELKKIGGLAIRNKNKVDIIPNGEYIKDLSKLPEIPYEIFPLEDWLYVGKWYAANIPEQPHWRFNDKVINVHGGRGCPFKCNFCYHHNKARYRDINIMMNEAEKYLEKYGGNMLYFSDDLVLTNKRRIQELLARIKKLKRKISYSVSCRFDILDRLNDEILYEMKETGCRIMGLGIESGSDRILKLIGKNITAEKILKGLERLKKVGILPTVSIMVGQFTETRDDVEKSISLMIESVRMNPLIQYTFSITTPFPGSELYNIIFKNGYLKNDEEFYNKYFDSNINGWNQVVNLSEMSDEEVIKYRDELDRIYMEEKLKSFDKKTSRRLQIIFDRQKMLGKEYEDKLKEEKEKLIYESKQLKLENEKLKLMGIL